MSLNVNNQAMLLLSMRFSQDSRGEPTSLTPTEYGRFSRWLHENTYEPKDLFSRFGAVSQGWNDPKGKITTDRLEHLLGRGAAMGLALESWASAGIWILTRADPDYPERLKRKLREVAPPVLLGVGDQRLLNVGGLAIVGSRNVDPSDQAYAQQVAQSAARSGMNVVSGGARGVDETAMLAALEVDGTATGVLANGLLSAALSGKWRRYVKKKDLCLVSTNSPEAPFQVGHAMGRNKYIYCLADYALIVRSEKGEGGTWAGATEALKKNLAPVFVRPDSDAPGNAALIHMGSTPLPAPPADSEESGAWLTHALTTPVDSQSSGQGGELAPPSPSSPFPLEGPDLFYSSFAKQLEDVLSAKPEVTLQDLKIQHPDLTAKQITDWLGKAVEADLIERRGRSHRYTLKAESRAQQSLFDSEES